MKLRNKKTGEIKEYGSVGATTFADGGVLEAFAAYDSLAELNEEWEDVPEEPNTFWYIDDFIPMCALKDGATNVEYCAFNTKDAERLKSIGNYFETKEEAEKAVEKLKAWKRLKDNSWKLVHYNIATREASVIFSTVYTITEQDRKDLDLLFGGEDE